jgi:L-alanine-DL-glutamate epimerase-like enolase superfamily enzyme
MTRAGSLRITGIETREYRLPLDPPFKASWDPVPRDHFDATLVIVHAGDGLSGFGSGSPIPDRQLLEHFLKGVDPMQTEVVREICETVDFHGSRPWPVEVAVWDLVGRALDQPLWLLLGGRSERLVAYASSGERVEPKERVARVVAWRDRGVKAIKIRFSHGDWRRDVEVVEEVRQAIGSTMQIMVDVNQGWRMPGDRRRPWDVPTATAVARALEGLDVYWLEEPLPTSNVDGYALLRQRTGIRIAAGEMVRSLREARELLVRGGVDVVQPDVVLAGGIGGCRRIAAMADLFDRMFSPHTWSNGLGMVANLHLAMAVSSCEYIEIPYDPPAWSPARRDYLLPQPLEIAADGTIRPPEGPGLGVTPDLHALERFRVG